MRGEQKRRLATDIMIADTAIFTTNFRELFGGPSKLSLLGKIPPSGSA